MWRRNIGPSSRIPNYSHFWQTFDLIVLSFDLFNLFLSFKPSLQRQITIHLIIVLIVLFSSSLLLSARRLSSHLPHPTSNPLRPFHSSQPSLLLILIRFDSERVCLLHPQWLAETTTYSRQSNRLLFCLLPKSSEVLRTSRQSSSSLLSARRLSRSTCPSHGWSINIDLTISCWHSTTVA